VLKSVKREREREMLHLNLNQKRNSIKVEQSDSTTPPSSSKRRSRRAKHGGDTKRNLTARITEGREVRRLERGSDVLGDQHVEYTIKVKKTAEWSVKRRYKDFEDFRHKLKMFVSSKFKDRSLKVPKLPKKRGVFQKLVSTQNKKEFVVSRGKGLDRFLGGILNQREFMKCPDLNDFLTKPTDGHVASRAPEIFKIYTEPKPISTSVGIEVSGSMNLRSPPGVGIHQRTYFDATQHVRNFSSDSEPTVDEDLNNTNTTTPMRNLSIRSDDSTTLLSSRSARSSTSTSSSPLTTTPQNKNNKLISTRSLGDLDKQDFELNSSTNESKMSRSLPLESQPGRRRESDDLLRRLSERQFVTYNYDDEEDFMESVSEDGGVVLVTFPKSGGIELVVKITESNSFRDRVELRGTTTLNGHISLFVGYASKLSLEGEAEVMVPPPLM